MAFQKILHLSYVDKLLDDIQLEFRDKFKNDLKSGVTATYQFDQEFKSILKAAENAKKVELQIPKQMRTFAESKKSQKTVASLKVDKNEVNKNAKSKEEGEPVETVQTTMMSLK